MSDPDYQDAQDKQQTQYLLAPRSKWKMHHRCKRIRSQSVQIFGYVCQNTNGVYRGPVWKIQSFLLSEICTVILWQDYYRRGNSRKFYRNKVGKKFQNGNAYSLPEKKDYSCLCMWTIKNWLERNKTLTQCLPGSWPPWSWWRGLVPVRTLAPDWEARSQPGSPLRTAPVVCRCSVSSPMMGDTPSGVVARRTCPSGVASFGRVTHAPADPRALPRAMMRSTYIRLGLRAHGASSSPFA